MPLVNYSFDSGKTEAPFPIKKLFQQWPHYAGKVAGMLEGRELFVLNTAQGADLFFSLEDNEDFLKAFLRSLNAGSEVPLSEVQICMSKKEGAECIRHFFQRAIGMSVTRETNEVQTFRKQFDFCKEARTVGPLLRKLYQRGLWLGEKARIELNMQLNAVTSETVVSDLAQKIFGDLQEHKALFFTNTVACESYIKRLKERKIGQLFFNSSRPGVESLCERYHGRKVDTAQLDSILHHVDLIFLFESSAVQQLLDLKIARVMQKRRNAPLLLVSLFERNGTNGAADPFEKLYNVFSYNQGDLQSIVNANLKEHQKVLTFVERLIEKEVEGFFDWLNANDHYRFGNIIGRSDSMQRILELVARIAQTDISVLIDGESGTGKELVARSIHEHSRRSENPFVAVNCGAIPETLLESELFGHVKGAFTGAAVDKKGLIEEANNGTIFLDEIAETSQATQVKLLRFLQEGEIKSVGSNETRNLSVRVLTATNRDLEKMVEQGDFRQDLYYRLNVIQITIPPLRERKDDIIPLVNHFIKKFAEQLHKSVYGLEEDARKYLCEHSWPGNVRELENAIEHAVALCSDEFIAAADLPPTLSNSARAVAEVYHAGDLTLKELEKQHIANLLAEHDWDYDLVTEILGIGRTTLWRKMKEYGITK